MCQGVLKTGRPISSSSSFSSSSVFPEFERGIEYSQAQRRHVMDQHRFQALGSNEGEQRIAAPVSLTLITVFDLSYIIVSSGDFSRFWRVRT